MKDFETHKFLMLLDEKEIKYHYEGKWLIIDGNDEGNFLLNDIDLIFLPNYIKFNNKKDVDFYNNLLKSLPDNIEFNNGGWVELSRNMLTSLPDGIKFNNSGFVDLYGNNLTSLPDNIDEWYDKLSGSSKNYIKEKFPDHWIVDKERFNL